MTQRLPNCRVGRLFLWVWLLLASAPVFADARASLLPERITLGGTCTLTIETDEVNVQPDFSPLEQNFIVRGQSSSVQTTITNGAYSARTTYAVELEPRSEGVLTVPAISVGNSQTQTLSLTVLPAQQGSAARGDVIYIESELGTTTPYVQQAVPYTVRLYYAVPLVNGDVSASAPEHASLQQLGEDRQSQVEIGGRRYGVFERRYLLIPEQSGRLQLPAASFRGTAQSGGGNGFFSRAQSVSAVGQAFELEVRAQPANAPKPWLAARSLALVRADLAPSARVGEPLLIELTMTADGTTSAQLPDLELPPIDAAQVFPEPAQRSDSIVAGQPVASLKRRFAVVPGQAGRMQLPSLRIAYWNTERDSLDTAELSALTLDVAAAASVTPVPTPAVVAPDAYALGAGSNANAIELNARLMFWQTATLVSCCSLLLALLWGWRRGTQAPRNEATTTAKVSVAPVDSGALRRALAQGELSDIAEALRRSTTPVSLNLGALRAQLLDAEQIDALDALQEGLWAGADADRKALRTRLATAFKSGPRLRPAAKPSDAALLPALYPLRN